MNVLYLHNETIDSLKANLVQVESMCEAMSNTGMKVTLSLPKKINNKYDIKQIEKGYHLHERELLLNNHKFDKYINYRSIKKVISNVNPDIIYLRNPLLLKQSLSSKKPVIFELHDTKMHLGYRFLDNRWRRLLIKMANTDQIIRIVCISQALRDYWVGAGLPEDKVIAAHDGISYKQFKTSMDQREARELLGIPADKKIVTYLGRLYKNRKIDAIHEIAKVYNDALFLVVGGPDSENFELKVKAEQLKLNNVIYTGQVPHAEIATYLYASDVLLALWSSEVRTINYCSPLKMFEYMAAGRITVAQGYPTILEVLKHNETAIICKPDSMQDLTDKVGMALNREYPDRMAEAARKKALETYTWDKRINTIFSGLS